VTESHGFVIPEDVSLPISINAVLKYRSAPQELIDHLLGEEFEVPVVEMTRDSQILDDGDKSMSGFQVTFPVIVGFMLLVFFLMGRKR